MNELRVLRTQVALTAEVVEACLTDLTQEDGRRTAIPGVTGVNWILGSRGRVNGGVLELLLRPGEPSSADLARYAAGTPPIEDGADAWDLAEVRDAFRRQTAPR